MTTTPRLTHLELVLAIVSLVVVAVFGFIAIDQGFNGATVQLVLAAVVAVLVIMVLRKVPKVD